MVVFWITVAIGGLWVVLFAKGLADLKRMPRIRPARDASCGPLPRVSVILPARNEEQNIVACVRSLLDQDHRDIEIVVVDDNSTDQTAALVTKLAAKDARVRLVQVSHLPQGWTGKCNAIHQGLSQGKPSGPWLLFTDADTVHSPQSLSAPLQVALDRKLDFITLVPHLEALSFWEKLLQPSIAALIGMFQNPSRINSKDNEEVFANGQYLLVRAEAYWQAGGHAGVCGKVLEDDELAAAVVRSGGRLFLAMGRDLFSTRMYSSLSSLIEGWGKNLYLILGSKLSRVFLAASLSVVMSLWPALTGLASAAALLFGWQIWPTGYLWTALGIYVVVLVFQACIRKSNRWYPAYTPLAPLANIMTVYILLRSTWAHRRQGGVSWKGRVIFDDQDEKP